MNDFETLVSSLAREARADAGAHHMDEQALFDYHTGALDPALEERWREHLVSCPQCTAQLLELAPLAAPEPPPGERVADLEVMASWKELQSRIEQPQDEARPPRSWHLGVAAAAILVFATGLTFDDLRLRRELRVLRITQAELKAPLANPTLIKLGLPDRYGEPEYELADDPFLVLSCTLPFDYREDQATYELRLLTAGGEERVRRPGLTNDAGIVRARVHRDKLPPGEYRAQIYLLGGDEPRSYEYRFRLREGPRDPVAESDEPQK